MQERNRPMSQRITRRTYLKSTAAAAAAFSIVPAGLARGYAANEKVNIGIPVVPSATRDR